MSEPVTKRVGFVAIGRDEGERLRSCLESVGAGLGHVVYVDSGSTDGSVELARSAGADVVELDTSRPLTAARGRNAGFEHLVQVAHGVEFVQFIDGDSEMIDGWLDEALEYLATHPDVGAVCGRIVERYPNASVYNRLCDMEWNRPAGETRACGGNTMIRVEAFRQAGGFLSGMVAGEEAELCARLRQKGWRIVQLSTPMVLHDAGMTRLGQWWKRAVRAGRAYAESLTLHRHSQDRHNIRGARSAVLWGAGVPAAALVLGVAAAWHPWTLAFLALIVGAYGTLLVKVYRHRRERGERPRHALLYASFCLLAKVPQCIGVVGFACSRLRRTRPKVVACRSAGEA